ncbi:hypothetical protein OAU80_00605 [Opitutales bacterium]|nr:hypothetical protein [Opitutales bacterium]
MKRVLLIFSLPTLVFCGLIVLSLNKTSELDLLSKNLDRYQKELFQIRTDLKLEMLFSSDLRIAEIEWEHWTKLGKKNILFWNEFLNSTSNLHTSHTTKSSSVISTEINKLLSYLNRSCKGKNVNFNVLNQLESSLTVQPIQAKESFGFGFTSYDGFWPSFDKREANTIYIQSKIIKEFVQYYLSSFDSESTNLISIKRESAGSTDSLHIQDDIFYPKSDSSSLRSSNLIKSYLFEISFSGKTRNCRSFINQLLPPFSLRTLQVTRKTSNIDLYESNFPESNSNNTESGILPIIRDITSIFTMEIEYVYDASNDLSGWLTEELSHFGNPTKCSELLSLLK